MPKSHIKYGQDIVEVHHTILLAWVDSNVGESSDRRASTVLLVRFPSYVQPKSTKRTCGEQARIARLPLVLSVLT
jgi:hypothetical protein